MLKDKWVLCGTEAVNLNPVRHTGNWELTLRWEGGLCVTPVSAIKLHISPWCCDNNDNDDDDDGD